MHAVFPSDLFAFRVGAAVIADADLVNLALQLGDFRRDFGFEPEAVFLNLNGLNDLPPEQLVTGFHVREIEVREHVGKRGQHAIPDPVPIVENPVRLAARKARTEHDIGLVLEHGFHQLGIFVRIVFQIRVLDDHGIAGGCGDASAERRALALIDFVVKNLRHPPRRLDFVFQLFASSVGRAIVDDDDLLVAIGRIVHRIDDLIDGADFVVTGNDDG